MMPPERRTEIAVIGGGSAGMAAAVAAREAGARDVVIVDREPRLGGILNQCIHPGFGLERYGEDLTGPEYLARDAERVRALDIDTMLDTMVLDLSADRVLTLSNREGILRLRAGAVVLAMGCRERTRDNLLIPGTRPAGVFTAGTAQALVNLSNLMVGRHVVILGSGDIGLIMARRMALEGARVEMVVEIMPYPGGLPRNVRQCLEDLDIPLLLRHTVVEVRGEGRVSSVVVAEVDDRLRPVTGTEREVPCDTLLLSVGLIPENELSRGAGIEMDGRTCGPVVDGWYMSTLPGVFCCGNVLHVHDVVDQVSEEGALAGRAAARWVRGERPVSPVRVTAGEGIRYVVPQRIGMEGGRLGMRAVRPGRDVVVVLRAAGQVVHRRMLPRVVPSEMIVMEAPRPPVGTSELVVEVMPGD